MSKESNSIEIVVQSRANNNNNNNGSNHDDHRLVNNKSLPSSSSSASDSSDGSNASSDVGALRDDHANGNGNGHGGAIVPRTPEASYTVADVMNKNFVELKWSDLRYSVDVPLVGKKGTEEKVLIDGISGVARSGSVTALMGSSGAGKSTLLDLLAGRIKMSSHVSGNITVNGANRDSIKGIKNIIAYVMQNDSLHPLLTVRETIRYSADLRLPALSAAEREERVNKVIEELGLQRVADTRIGDEIHRGISGGEKRRVSIGVELVIQPKLLFLDEPTSGLDSTSAFEVIAAIHRLAKGETGAGKRCIILSIHQPSSRLFAMMDQVVFLSSGVVVYQGPVPKVGEFMAHVGQPVPANTNPADHILDVVTDCQKADKVKALVSSFETFRSNVRRSNAQQLDHKLQQNDLLLDAPTDKRAAMKPFPAATDDEPAIVSWPSQIAVLLRLNLTNTLRTKELFVQRVMVNCLVSFIMGSLFFDPSGATEVEDYRSFIVFTVALINFTAVEVMPIFLNNRTIFMREYSNGYYRLSAYVAADFLTAIPISLAIGATYSFIGYWMVMFNPDAGNYFFFIYAITIMSLAANSFVVMISSFVPNGIAGNAMATTIFAFMFLFSGFFIKRDDIPNYWIWFHYLSLFKYGLEALSVNQFDDNLNTVFECNRVALAVNPDCRLTPGDVRDDLDVDNINKFGSIGCLIAFAVGFRVLMLLILKGKGTKRK